MKLLTYFVRYSSRLILLAIVVGLVGGASTAALIGLTNTALTGAGKAVIGSAAGFISLVLVVIVFNYLARALVLYLTKQSALDLRLLFCRQIVNTPLSRLEEMGNHRILATLTEDIANLSGAFSSLPSLCIYGMTVIGCFAYLSILSPSMVVFSFVYLAMVIASCLIPEARANRFLANARDDWDKVARHFQGMIEGMKQLKLHSRRSRMFLSGPLTETATAHRRNSFKGENIYAVTRSWVEAQYFIVWGIILFNPKWFGGMTAGRLVAYTLTVLYLRTPILVLVETIPILSQGRISLQKIEQAGLSLEGLNAQKLALEAQHNGSLTQESQVASFEQIQLRRVSHNYYREKEENEFALGPIDLTIHAGEVVFLIGGNGSGKTTLLKLLTGLYTPVTGEIRIDGRLITVDTQEWYRQHFSAIFADYYLFESLFGVDLPAKDLDTRAQELLVLLHLDHKVHVKNGVLSTTQLSHGQRKRLALLNAYLEDRPIYIFDEWAADQDPLFKKVFYCELLADLKARGKTVLVVSHDDRYYQMADRIIKMESGQLLHDEENSSRSVALEQGLSLNAGEHRGWD